MNTMKYKIVEGRNVIEAGWVIIDGISHYVHSGYICCNSSMNNRAWNITQKKSICPKCLEFTNTRPHTLTLKTEQLSLF